MAFQKARALQEAEKSVAQGKISQAIRQYQEILDNDPSDVSLLNTIGDLYIRDRNITEGFGSSTGWRKPMSAKGSTSKPSPSTGRSPRSIPIPLKPS